MKKNIIINLLVCSVVVVAVSAILFFICGMWWNKSKQEIQKTEHFETKEKTQLLDWKIKEDKEGIFMDYLNTTAEYAQVYKNNYYFLRCKGNNYTIYMNKGQKVGTFHLEEGIELLGFVKSGEYFFAKYQREGEHIVNLARINLQENSLEESIYSVFYTTFDELPTDYFFYDCIYSVKENVMNDATEYEITCRNLDGVIVDEYNVTLNNEKYNPYQIVKMTKEEILFEEIERGKRIFYVYNLLKNKCKRVTQLIFPDYKKINNNTGQYKFEQDILVAMFPKKGLFSLYSISYNEEEIELLSDKVRDFSCYDRYICYIDKDYVVHKYDRQTEEDIILDSKLKVMSLNCTNMGIWMREYDKLCVEDSEGILNSHADPLYYMNYVGDKRGVREK